MSIEIRRWQTPCSSTKESISLPVSDTAGDVVSPYFQSSDMRKIGTGRIKSIILSNMSKLYVSNLFQDPGQSDSSTSHYNYSLSSPGLGNSSTAVDITLPKTAQQIAAELLAQFIQDGANIWSLSLTADDVIFPEVAWKNPNLSFANPSRSLNSAFQVSTNRDSIVNYTVDIAATLSLTTGQAGTVSLKYADDSGMTTNVVTVQSSVNGNAGTLAIGLGLTQTATAALGGVIPAGKYVKLVTTNTVGTPTFTMRAAQEVLI